MATSSAVGITDRSYANVSSKTKRRLSIRGRRRVYGALNGQCSPRPAFPSDAELAYVGAGLGYAGSCAPAKVSRARDEGASA